MQQRVYCLWFYWEGMKRARREQGAGRGEETRRRETVGRARWQGAERQADLLSQLQAEAFPSNKQDCDPASTLGVRRLWQEIKYCAIMRSTFHTWAARRLHTDFALASGNPQSSGHGLQYAVATVSRRDVYYFTKSEPDEDFDPSFSSLSL